MGGFGSGRHAGQVKDTVEDSRFLKASWVKVQAEALRQKKIVSIGWNRQEQSLGTVAAVLSRESLNLSYRYRCNGSEWSYVSEFILIERCPCRLLGAGAMVFYMPSMWSDGCHDLC